jgi:hypothetical protein
MEGTSAGKRGPEIFLTPECLGFAEVHVSTPRAYRRNPASLVLNSKFRTLITFRLTSTSSLIYQSGSLVK